MSYTVYILQTSSNTLYTGQTNNLDKRIKQHSSKTSKGAKYMKYFDAFELVYKEECPTLIQALSRERQIKEMTKTKKEELIKGIKINLDHS